jgi:DNA-binding CsgD family transcriptional regulator
VPQMAFLKDEFDLTPAEVRLLLRLIEGKSLRSSAAALGIKYETARTVLKNVFRKTGTCRQAELVVMIVNAMERQRAEYLGTVEAADEKAAEAVPA